MNNIVNIKDKRTRSIAENYTNLCQQSRTRFSDLKAFNGQNFESNEWRYYGETLYFSTIQGSRSNKRLEWPDEINKTIKSFIINQLWGTRTRKTPLSASRVISLRHIGPYIIEAKAMKIEDFTHDLYISIYNIILENYDRPQVPLQDLNLYLRYLQQENLLTTQIDIISPAKHKATQEKQGSPALKEKMPIPELVRAIVQLKWAVEDQFDESDRATSDLLSIYTQAFQYSMGLRIGEVLRLPVDCLQEVNGELMCKVWTEKGMTPHSRYIPLVWRPLLLAVVKEIQNITRPYRDNAKELETTKSLTTVRDRLDKFIKGRRSNANELLTELDVFLIEKKLEAQKAWALKKEINPTSEYTLIELAEILPISSASKTTAMMMKAYSSWGIELTIRPLDAKRNKYSVRGQAIVDFINFHIDQRINNITEQELLTVIHGKQINRQVSGDKTISKLSKTGEGGTAACYTFAPSTFEGKGRAPALITRSDAAKKLTEYAHGGFDIEKNIDVITFREIFPELILLTTNSKNKDFKKLNPDFEISNKQKITVKVKTDNSHIRYSVNEGFTISQQSIEGYIYNKFIDNNFALEKELHEFNTEDVKADFDPKAITIESKSFSREQKISEFLFLRADIGSGSANPLSPEMLGYKAVMYFFMGNDRYPNAFKKYGLDIADHITDSWQSHKGRHWQTSSLFRAGVQPAIVNKWMGRTDLQGAHYDHNTGTERAKLVGAAMLEDQNRFVGEIPQKVRQWLADEIPESDISAYLEQSMQTIQFTPIGYCSSSLHLNPCELNLKCLVGTDGNGCKHFVFDLKDESQRTRLIAEKDKSEAELTRLLDVYDSGVLAAEMHIKHHLGIVKNASITIEKAEALLGTTFTGSKNEFLPFLEDGSFPDDCPFQCGDDQ